MWSFINVKLDIHIDIDIYIEMYVDMSIIIPNLTVYLEKRPWFTKNDGPQDQISSIVVSHDECSMFHPVVDSLSVQGGRRQELLNLFTFPIEWHHDNRFSKTSRILRPPSIPSKLSHWLRTSGVRTSSQLPCSWSSLRIVGSVTTIRSVGYPQETDHP